ARPEHARPDAAPAGERGRGAALLHRRERGRTRPRGAARAHRTGAALLRLRHPRGRGGAGTCPARASPPAPGRTPPPRVPGAEDLPPALLTCVPPARPGEAPAREAR